MIKMKRKDKMNIIKVKKKLINIRTVQPTNIFIKKKEIAEVQINISH